VSIQEKGLKIEIEITEKYVEFKHNGLPFTMDNLVYLIEQTSTKNRIHPNEVEPKKTGKFGTGFITTHLLSKIIRVRGIYNDLENKKYQRFEL
jgi:hypothetical protein